MKLSYFTETLLFKVAKINILWYDKYYAVRLSLGRHKITPSVKYLAPEAFSGAKLQVFMENGQKNEID